MNFGYKTFLALTIATAACWRAKAQSPDSENEKDSIEISNNNTSEIKQDSSDTKPDMTISFAEAREEIHSKIASGITSTLAEHSLQAYKMNKEFMEYIKQQDARWSDVSDSAKIERVCESLAEIEHDAVRFIAHFENIKMNAYWDRVAKKWTIGFGNITHPDGRPIRRGDRIKDEAELMLYFREYFRKNVAPDIAKYCPNWHELNGQEKIAMVDLFWNAGSGQNVLSNHKEYNPNLQNLTEEQRQEVAQELQNKNECVFVNGKAVFLSDLPEWHNLGVAEKTSLAPVYQNYHIAKGDTVNHSYSDKFQILAQSQRQEVAEMIANLSKKPNLDNLLFNRPKLSDKWNASIINDSTIRYRGYVTEIECNISDVPIWYTLKNAQQENTCKLLAAANGSVKYNGHIYPAKDIPAIYFMSKSEQEILQTSFGSDDLLIRKSTDNKKKSVLSNLGYELNLYALTKDPVAKERVSNRLASYIHSRGNVIPALQKRANIRAQVFLGKIQLNGEGTNSINLETVNIGAGYSVKISDLNDPQAICDTVNGCTFGKNFKDSLNSELAQTSKRSQQNIRRAQPQRRTQTRTTAYRTGARGR